MPHATILEKTENIETCDSIHRYPQCDGNCIHLLPNLKPTTSDITVYNFFAAYSQSQILATSNIKEKLRTILTPQVSYYVETYYIK